MRRESTVASILRPLFAVFAVFSILAATNSFFLKNYLLNPEIWVNSVDLKDFTEEAKETAIEAALAETNLENYSEVEDLIDDVVDEEFVSFVLEETFESAFYGDTKIDRDRLEELIEENAEDFFDDHDLSDRDLRDFVDSVCDDYEDRIDEISDEAEEEFIAPLQRFTKSINAIFIASTVITVIFLVVLIPIHKNKGLPIRAIGISMTVANFLNVAGAAGIGVLMNAAMKEASSTREYERYVVKTATNIVNTLSKNAILLFAGFLAVGIIMIIIGSVISSIYKKSAEEDSEEI